MLWEDMVGKKDEEFFTFEFPIRDLGGASQIHHVPPPILTNFHRLDNEDPDEFLFQLEILCRGYDVQNMKNFPLTLKGETL